MRESVKFPIICNDTEELQTDAGGNDQQAHGEQNQAAQFPARTKDLKQTNTTLFYSSLCNHFHMKQKCL